MATSLWSLRERREALLRRKAKLEAGRYETAHGWQFSHPNDKGEWEWIKDELEEIDEEMSNEQQN